MSAKEKDAKVKGASGMGATGVSPEDRGSTVLLPNNRHLPSPPLTKENALQFRWERCSAVFGKPEFFKS